MTAAPVVIDLATRRPREREAALVRQWLLDQDTADCLADAGHPHWPGWQWIVAALLAAQLGFAAQQALGAEPDPPRLPRTRGNPTKVVRRARPVGNRLRETWEVTAC